MKKIIKSAEQPWAQGKLAGIFARKANGPLED